MLKSNCIDVIKPFIEAINSRQANEVQIIGGINSVALVHPDTIIDTNNKKVIIPDSSELYLSTHRLDGTLRDLDVLVLSCDEYEIENVRQIVDETVGNSLEQSVFGFKSYKSLNKQLRNPFGIAALKTFLSDRYCLEDEDMMVKSLFPFSVLLEKQSLETWELDYDDMSIPIPNPAMSIINYTNRSISGVRSKDKSKVDMLASRVFKKAPELLDWAVDGPGASQVALGGLIRSLNQNKKQSNYFGSDKQLIPDSRLAEHESFMLPNLSGIAKFSIIALAQAKAMGLSYVESNTAIVTFWQKNVEKHVDSIVMNK